VKGLAIAALFSVVPGLAHADDRDPRGTRDVDVGLYVLIGALAANTAFTIYNVATIGERKSDLYAFGESILTVPQTIVFGGISMLDEGDGWGLTGFALWTAALAAHGIYTLSTDDDAQTSSRTVMLSIGERF
jgi:hypothetical protein